MSAKYCTKEGCGAKTEYTVKVPIFCSNCGQPFNKAFLGATPTINTPTVTHSQTNTSKRTTPESYRKSLLSEEDNETDSYDKGEVKEMARELAASVAGDVELVVVGNNSYKIEDILDPKKQVNVGVRGSVATEISE